MSQRHNEHLIVAGLVALVTSGAVTLASLLAMEGPPPGDSGGMMQGGGEHMGSPPSGDNMQQGGGMQQGGMQQGGQQMQGGMMNSESAGMSKEGGMGERNFGEVKEWSDGPAAGMNKGPGGMMGGEFQKDGAGFQQGNQGNEQSGRFGGKGMPGGQQGGQFNQMRGGMEGHDAAGKQDVFGKGSEYPMSEGPIKGRMMRGTGDVEQEGEGMFGKGTSYPMDGKGKGPGRMGEGGSFGESKGMGRGMMGGEGGSFGESKGMGNMMDDGGRFGESKGMGRGMMGGEGGESMFGSRQTKPPADFSNLLKDVADFEEEEELSQEVIDKLMGTVGKLDKACTKAVKDATKLETKVWKDDEISAKEEKQIAKLGGKTEELAKRLEALDEIFAAYELPEELTAKYESAQAKAEKALEVLTGLYEEAQGA